MKKMVSAAVVAVTASAGSARADGWLVAEAPAALAVSDAQEGVFRPGVMPAVGAYLDNGWIALGLRLRAGILRNGPAPAGNLMDPGVGGLGTAGLGLRLHLGGGWVEGVGGGGVTGHDWVPSVEAGAGWSFQAGSVDLGPSVRFVHVISNDNMDSLGSASLLLVGVDVKFGGHKPQPVHHVVVPPAPPPPAPLPAESDHDRIEEHEQSCATDADGCVLAEGIVLHGDRIVLEERVLFDFGQARVRSYGREMIARLAEVWRNHPEWKHVTIEGHTDMRGSDEYNQWLSEARANRTRDVFVKLGFAPDQLDAVGFGRSRPRFQGDDEATHARNRRVEFVIQREIPSDTTPALPPGAVIQQDATP